MLTKFERVFQGRRKMYCEKSENQIKARLPGKMSPQNDGGCSGEAAPSHIISSPSQDHHLLESWMILEFK